MRGKVSVVFLGMTLLMVSGCMTDGNVYPPEAAGQTGNSCCYAFDDYPPYYNNYYDPSMPWGVYRGPSVPFHAHGGFTGEVHPGYRENLDWDDPALVGQQCVGYDDNDYRYGGSAHHRHKHHHHMQQGGNAPAERSRGAGQNENYGRDNGDNR